MKKVFAIMVIISFGLLGLTGIIMPNIEIYKKFGLIGVLCFFVYAIIAIVLIIVFIALLNWAKNQLK